jgi:hypothetical protein
MKHYTLQMWSDFHHRWQVILGVPHQTRCSTWEEAERQHAEAVEFAKTLPEESK